MSVDSVTSVILLTGCLTTRTKLEAIKEIQITTDEAYPVETLQNAKLMYSDSAIVRVILNATQMDRYVGDEPYLEITKGLKVQFFNPSGSKESELTAQYAKIDEEKNLMEAKNTVKVKNVNGDLLETEHLVWNEKTEMVYTEEFVKITTKDEVIYGEGLESNQDFTKYTIKKISGILYKSTNDAIVLIEFANPAFCIKTNDGLLDNCIPHAIPIASSSLVAIITFFFLIPSSIKFFNVESGTPIKFSI